MKLLTLTAGLVLTFNATLSFAHDQGGALGTSASATDYYQVNCFDDGNGAADRLSIMVMDSKPVAAPIVSLQVTKGKIAYNTTDAKDADAGYSPEVMLRGGNGSYFVAVNKTASGAELYTFQYHCETADNAHTGTTIIPLQNQ